MSAEIAVEMLGDDAGRVVAERGAAGRGRGRGGGRGGGGASLDEVAAEARGALAMKTAADSVAPEAAPALERRRRRRGRASRPTPSAGARGPQRDRAARAAGGAVRRDCPAVRRRRAGGQGGGGAPVSARSLTNWCRSGRGSATRLSVSASGPQADDVVAGAGAAGRRGVRRRASAAAARRRRSISLAGQPCQASSQPARRSRSLPPAAGRRARPGSPPRPGIAIGPARHLHGATAAAAGPRRRTTRRASANAARPGLAAARTAIERDRETVAARAGKAEAEIFDAHLALLDDEALLEPAGRDRRPARPPSAPGTTRPSSVAGIYRALARAAAAERAADVVDVGRRVVVGARPGEPTSRRADTRRRS